MRRIGLSALAVAVASTAVAVAQPMPPRNLQPVQGFAPPAAGAPPVSPGSGTPIAPAAVDPAVLAHLTGWEKAMTGLASFYVKAEITKKNKVLRRESKFSADAWCLKGKAPMARLDMNEVPAPGKAIDPTTSTTYISTGRELYEYSGADRTVTVVELGATGRGSHLLLDLIGGMSAKETLDRFDIRVSKEDKDYVFLEVKPKLREDKSEFETMTLVLVGAANPTRAYMPRMVILNKPGGQETESWDFPDPQVNPKGIDASFFNPVAVPKGWKENKIPLPRGGGGVKAPGVPTSK